MDKARIGVDIDKLAAELTEGAAVETADPSRSLLPQSAQKQRLNLEVTQALTTHFENVWKGINYLLERLEHLIADNNPEVSEGAYTEILKKLSAQNFADLTLDEQKIFFIAAADMYNQQEYDQAADAFYVLTILNPKFPLFWKCLGNCQFFGNHFEEAIAAYSAALKIDSNDAESLLYQARSLINEKRTDEAIEVLHRAEGIIAKAPQFEPLKDNVTDLLHEIEK